VARYTISIDPQTDRAHLIEMGSDGWISEPRYLPCSSRNGGAYFDVERDLVISNPPGDFVVTIRTGDDRPT
jgi:hypothetical protein